jgi:hypothetical protein
MKHLTFGDKALFVGDAAADTLLEYAARLADAGRADTVELEAIGPDGHSVTATFLLDPGASLMAETADDSAFQEPDNAAAVERMKQAMQDLRPSPISEMSDDEVAALGRPFDEDAARNA